MVSFIHREEMLELHCFAVAPPVLLMHPRVCPLFVSFQGMLSVKIEAFPFPFISFILYFHRLCWKWCQSFLSKSSNFNFIFSNEIPVLMCHHGELLYKILYLSWKLLTENKTCKMKENVTLTIFTNKPLQSTLTPTPFNTPRSWSV